MEPLREDQPRGGGRGLGAVAALLDRDGDDDRPALVGHVTDVPRLVGLVGPRGGAGLAVPGLREAAEHVDRGAARGARGEAKPFEYGLAVRLGDLQASRDAGLDALLD